jgi:hypothetical protein
VKGKKIIEVLNREIIEIKTRRSSVQNVMKSIRARESCLLQIINLCGTLANMTTDDSSLIESHVSKASELLSHLRILSLNVVECVLRWRQYLVRMIKICRPQANTSRINLIFQYEG